MVRVLGQAVDDARAVFLVHRKIAEGEQLPPPGQVQQQALDRLQGLPVHALLPLDGAHFFDGPGDGFAALRPRVHFLLLPGRRE